MGAVSTTEAVLGIPTIGIGVRTRLIARDRQITIGLVTDRAGADRRPIGINALGIVLRQEGALPAAVRPEMVEVRGRRAAGETNRGMVEARGRPAAARRAAEQRDRHPTTGPRRPPGRHPRHPAIPMQDILREAGTDRRDRHRNLPVRDPGL
jgi:hypothetical protein